MSTYFNVPSKGYIQDYLNACKSIRSIVAYWKPSYVYTGLFCYVFWTSYMNNWNETGWNSELGSAVLDLYQGYNY